MLVKITRTHHRALDPRTIKTFNANEVLEFDEELALDIIKNGFGVEHKELKAPIENKAIFEAPENKEAIEEAKEELKEISEEENKKESEEKSKKKNKK